MSLFRLKITPYSRGAKATKSGVKKGSNTSALLAYRTGEALRCERDGEKKYPHGDVSRVSKNTIFGMENGPIPGTKSSIQKLASAIDESEKRVNSRLGRDYVFLLPKELDPLQKQALSNDLAAMLSRENGSVVCASTHDLNKKNSHLHAFEATRKWDKKSQKFGAKLRFLDDRKLGPKAVENIREKGAKIVQKHLEKAKIKAKVTHMSYRRQGLDRPYKINTRFIPKDPKNHTMKDRKILKYNKKIEDLLFMKVQRKVQQNFIKEEEEKKRKQRESFAHDFPVNMRKTLFKLREISDEHSDLGGLISTYQIAAKFYHGGVFLKKNAALLGASVRPFLLAKKGEMEAAKKAIKPAVSALEALDRDTSKVVPSTPTVAKKVVKKAVKKVEKKQSLLHRLTHIKVKKKRKISPQKPAAPVITEEAIEAAKAAERDRAFCAAMEAWYASPPETSTEASAGVSPAAKKKASPVKKKAAKKAAKKRPKKKKDGPEI